MYRLLLAIGVLFCFITTSHAATINVHIELAFNGSDQINTQGFKLYQQVGSADPVVVATIEGKATRVWDGDIEVQPGRSFYTLTAFAPDQESPHSDPPVPFEYMEPATPGYPAPQLIIKFN